MEIDYKELFKWQQKSNTYYLRVCGPEKREPDLEARLAQLQNKTCKQIYAASILEGEQDDKMQDK